MELVLIYYNTIVLTLAILSFIAAVMFLICPNFLIYLNKTLRKEIAPGKILCALDKSKDVDGNIMNMRKTFGVLSIVVGLVLIFIYTKY